MISVANNLWNALRHASGGSAPGDTDPPGVSGNMVISANGLTGVITLDEDSDETSVPDPGDFALNGTPVLVDAVAYTDATHLELTFDSPILASETVTWDYTAGANPIRDLALNELENVSGGATTNGSGIEAELVVTTYYDSWSLADTEYLPHRSLTALVLAGGGGGDRNSGTGVNASGGAGELRIVEITDAAPGGYSGTIGAAGAAGTGGNATNGTNSTASDAGGQIAQANAGTAGNANTTTAGTGGSGGSGGTGRSGGNGATATNANVFGGATGGTSTDSSESNPGEPDGHTSNVGSTASAGTGGGVQSTIASRDGGAGQCVVFYQRGVTASSRPRAVAMGWGRDTTVATARDISVPGTHVSNDRLVTNLGAASGSTIGMASWTSRYNDGAGACFVRDGDGADPVTVTTSANRRVAWHATRVRGAAVVANTSATGTAVASAQPNPPSHDHGSSVNAVWFACCAATSVGTGIGEPTQPANYPGMYVPPFIHATTVSSVFVGIRPLLATQTENPGEITFPVNITGAAWTLCVPS